MRSRNFKDARDTVEIYDGRNHTHRPLENTTIRAREILPVKHTLWNIHEGFTSERLREKCLLRREEKARAVVRFVRRQNIT